MKRKPFELQCIKGVVGRPDPVRMSELSECFGQDDCAGFEVLSGWGASHASATGKFHGLSVSRRLDFEDEIAGHLACKEVYVHGAEGRLERAAVTEGVLAHVKSQDLEIAKILAKSSCQGTVFSELKGEITIRGFSVQVRCERVRLRRLVLQKC